MTLVSQKMGIHEWSYDNAIMPAHRFRVPLKDTKIALKSIKIEVELGFDPKLAFAEAQRCLNCDVQTVFADKLCIECDACVDICPMDCINFTANGEEADLRPRLRVAGRQPDAGPLRVGCAQDRARDGQGRGRLPALRAVRRALPDRRVGHAEVPARHGARRRSLPRQPTAADYRRPRAGARAGGGGVTMDAKAAAIRVNDFVVKFANVNGSGSASANGLFARAVLRMGVPVSARNIFPSNIQGLPTWYEVRVSEEGWRGRRGGVDLMVAMNPQTWDKDVAELDVGGMLFYDSTRPVPAVAGCATTSP